MIGHHKKKRYEEPGKEAHNQLNACRVDSMGLHGWMDGCLFTYGWQCCIYDYERASEYTVHTIGAVNTEVC